MELIRNNNKGDDYFLGLIKMAYVIVREDIRNPLINTQVLNLLKKIKQQSVDIEIYLLWFFRVDYIFRGRKEINGILQEVKSNNINMV